MNPQNLPKDYNSEKYSSTTSQFIMPPRAPKPPVYNGENLKFKQTSNGGFISFEDYIGAKLP